MYRNKVHIRHEERRGTRRQAEQVVGDLLQARFAANDRVLIAVGGPGGTGKSSFCRKLANLLPDASVLRLDDYKTPREQRRENNLFGPHPDANHMALIRDHLAMLRAGKTIQKPIYSAERGRADHQEAFQPRRFNLLDGEVATYHCFHDLVDLAIFIDADWKTQLGTRISRDIEQRGYSREKAIATFLQSNLREFAEYGAESKKWADIHLFCHADYRLQVESVEQALYKTHEAIFQQDFSQVELSGLVVSLPTPFNTDDRIDQKAFTEHLDYLAEAGIERILVNGITGEFYALLPSEQKILLELAREYFPGMILFQVGRDNLIQARQEALWGEEFGADAILALPPSGYGQATASGLKAYFKALKKDLSIPLLLTCMPHSPHAVSGELIQAIDCAGIVDYADNNTLISTAPRYFCTAFESANTAYQQSATGWISDTASLAPNQCLEYENLLANKQDPPITLAATLQDLENQLAGPDRVAKLKQALAAHITGYPARVRLPLMPPDE
jgi:uridine kinase/dihydrodipicolinate synthase/N-acetylneuraminate lyase